MLVKKKLLIVAMAVGMLILNAQVTYAEDEFPKDETSKASISFTGDNIDPTDPVDPDNPDNPGPGPGTGMEGPLSLDYVPTLEFGQHDLSNNVVTYNSIRLKPYIQVTDKRGTGEGWKIIVSLSSFSNVDDSESFSGVLNFKNGEILTTSNNPSNAPTTSDLTLTSEENGKTIFKASDNQGMGTWINRWYPTAQTETNDSMTLTVNTQGIKADVYTATMYWMISNAP